MSAQTVTTLQPQASNALTPLDMLDRALANNASVEVMERLMGLQERYLASKARAAFDEAVSEAKSQIGPIAKNKVGHNNKRYADFSAIARAVDPIISQFGLSYRFRTTQEGNAIHVTCILSHRDGHSEENTLAGPSDGSGSKNAIQAIGSTLTYLQRYSLVQALGLAVTEDDDGHAGSRVAPITQEQADALVDLLELNGKDRKKFLKWANVERIEDIPTDRYQACVDAIKRVPQS